MANEEHKHIILQGVNQWNTWRRATHDLHLTPDLSNIDLYNLDLKAANFAFTNLTGANLVFANLSGANLFGANLAGANLHRVNLIDAELTDANLTQADLTEAIFVETRLLETDFTNAVFGRTVLANLHLQGCKNLSTISHKQTSTLGIDTLLRSKGTLPVEFLRGVGLSESFIAYIHSLDDGSINEKPAGNPDERGQA